LNGFSFLLHFQGRHFKYISQILQYILFKAVLFAVARDAKKKERSVKSTLDPHNCGENID